MRQTVFPIFLLLGWSLSAFADPPDPNAWWKLDEGAGTTAYDSSGNGFGGTICGNPAWKTDFLGTVLELDGTGDYVEVQGYQGISGGQARSCCAWIRTNQMGESILTYGSGVALSDWLLLVSSTGRLQLGVSGGNIIGTTLVADGNWHHVAAVLEAPPSGPTKIQNLRLYVDGRTELGTYTNPDLELNTATAFPVRIGTRQVGDGILVSFFDGRIQDVRMYDTAMSAADIHQLFQEKLGLPGEGTTENPYQISTAEQLILIGATPSFMNDCFILTDDIVFDLNDNRDYIFKSALIAPDVGTDDGFQGTSFTGVFDGNHHAIRHLTIIGFNIEYIGLFGKTESAVIKDLVLEDLYIYAWTATNYSCCYTGGLAGQQVNSTISRCSADGSIDISTDRYPTVPYTGGLVGYQDGGIIQDCSAAVSAVSTALSTSYTYPIYPRDPYDIASSFAGGSVGYQNYGTIEHCYATGSVEASADGESSAGGLVGYQNSGSMKHCYATGSVEASANDKSFAGGLIGYQNGSIVEHCYATGYVSGFTYSVDFYDSYCSAGGLVGVSHGSLYNCYAISVTTSSTVHYLPHAGGLAGQTDGIISDCYALGSVSAFRYDEYYSFACGGLVGHNVSGAIKGSYAACIILGNDDRGGGLIGFQSEVSAVTENCFWDIQVSGKNVGCYDNYGIFSNVIGKTTLEMKEFNTFIFAGWDFVGEEENGINETWRMCADGVDYPRLSWEYGRSGDFSYPDGVGMEDLEALAFNWLIGDSDSNFNYACDGNGDGWIGLEDFSLLSQNWGQPHLAVSKNQIFVGAIEGSPNPDPEELVITNVGGGDLYWMIELDSALPDWLSIDPVSGSLGRGESEAVTLSADISGLSIGDYLYTFDVVDPNAANSPQAVTVNLRIGKLVGYWALDEEGGMTAHDGSGNGRDGMLLGFADPNSNWTAGKIGNCLAFDGVDDYVTMNGYAGVTGTQPRTVCAWIKTTQSTTGEFVSWGSMDTAAKWAVGIQNNVFSVRVQGGNIYGSKVINDGLWHHVAVTWLPGTNNMLSNAKLYVDGEEETISSMNDIEIHTASGGEVQIGNILGINFYQGLIDEVQMYNVALSVKELAELAGPMLHLSKNTFVFATCEYGTNPADKYLTIQNSGGILQWSIDISDKPDWLTITPTAGTLGTLEGELVTLSADAAGLSLGEYVYTFEVADPNAANNPQGVTVYLLIFPLPVAYWALDEEAGITAYDGSGSGYDGTLIGFADPNSNWTAGMSGNALAFDGVDDYVEAAGYPGITGTGSRTCSAWIRCDSDIHTGAYEILSWGTDDSSGARWLMMVTDQTYFGTGVLRLNVLGGYIEGATNLFDGKWHHVAAILADDGSPIVDEIKLYVDGLPEALTVLSSAAVNTASDGTVKIGVYSTRYFPGRIDEVRMYDAALSAGQIAVLAGQ